MRTRLPIQTGFVSARRRTGTAEGVSLIETVIAVAIAAMVIGGLITGFVQSARQAESSAYILAAQAEASQGLEQVRAAKWDPTVSTGAVDQVVSANFPPFIQLLDVPGSGSRPVYATNITTITTVSANPLLKMIRGEIGRDHLIDRAGAHCGIP